MKVKPSEKYNNQVLKELKKRLVEFPALKCSLAAGLKYSSTTTIDKWILRKSIPSRAINYVDMYLGEFAVHLAEGRDPREFK